MNDSSTHSTTAGTPPRPTGRGTTRRTALRALALATVLAGTSLSTSLPPAVAADGAETYTLTIRHLDRAGSATGGYQTHVTGISGAGASEEATPYDASGTVTVRLPKGRYLLDSTLTGADAGAGTDWIVQPRLDLNGDTTVTVDARTTAPVDVRPPESGARYLNSLGFVEVTHEGTTRSANILVASPGLRVAHLGPAAESGSVKEWFDTYWSGAKNDYALGYTFTSGRALTGLVRHPSAASLATVKIRGAAPQGAAATGFVSIQPSAGPTVGLVQPLQLPGTATVLVTPERGLWDIGFSGPAAPETPPNRYAADGVPVRAGATTTHTFDNAVFGPAIDRSPGARPAGVREGDTLALEIPLLADGDGHAPTAPRFHGATTTLHRDGVLVGTRQGDPGRASFTTTPGSASYRLTASATRGDGTSSRGRVTAAWTFTSAAAARPATLPLSAVRFAPALALDGTAPAGVPVRVPVTVEGAAAENGVRSLTVSLSTDDGSTWARVPVLDGQAVFRTPAPGRSVSLRAELTDAQGNTLTQTLTDAYRTR
ncbi:serine protease [Streptomyces sp. SR27]|uniref:serine protease n=1 Tax=Streptomyces sp. SR27 TaxID=3076630 RepID=UPI00295AF4FD|nr:serine protease [Streptomyces sp. SR27]MDV9190034.1 serine protease [Streptomyces sp. SR27]